MTGRALNTIFDEAHHNQVDPDVFICSNGALIADREKNILAAHWIPFDRACALIEYLKQSDFESFTFCNGEDSGYHVNEHIVQSPRSLERREKFFAKTISEAMVLAKGRMISMAAWISDRGRMAEMPGGNSGEVRRRGGKLSQPRHVGYRRPGCIETNRR